MFTVYTNLHLQQTLASEYIIPRHKLLPGIPEANIPAARLPRSQLLQVHSSDSTTNALVWSRPHTPPSFLRVPDLGSSEDVLDW